MSLRTRILIGSIVVAVVPLALALQVIRSTVRERFTDLDTARAEGLVRLVQDDLERQNGELARRLDALAATLTQDNRFRLGALAISGDDLAYVRDFAARQMSLMDLDLLQIQDENGRIVSSGHFREAHDEIDRRLPTLLERAPGGRALVTARHPAGSFLALARTRAIALGDQRYHLVGGTRIDVQHLDALNRDRDLALGVVWPEGSLATTDDLAARLDPERPVLELEFRLRRQGAVFRSEYLPVIHQDQLAEAWLLVTHDRTPLLRMLRDLNLRLAVVLAVGVTLAILLGIILAGSVSRPLRQLAARTEDLDLDRLDADFSSDRRDEVGRLTRLLGEMTGRLRDGVQRLRQAEHRATLGEVARQINHDIRNGITPLRNVLRHLSEVARDTPDRLPQVFADRRDTLEGGLTYLSDLAGHYERLGADRSPQPCSLAAAVTEAVAAPATTPAIRLVNAVPTRLPAVLADPISLRRIMDNLIRNALESLPEQGGVVTVDATLDEDPQLEDMRILVSVSDTGVGIEKDDLDRIFNDFFTTKPGGTGLGLSNVRRLAADCGATIRVTSEPGRGTTFTLSFPLPDADDGSP